MELAVKGEQLLVQGNFDKATFIGWRSFVAEGLVGKLDLFF